MRRLILSPMGVIEFEVERTIKAPIEDVFARLVDINGHNDWMPKKGSILRHTQQTSPGEPTLGTTFLDETTYGPTPGEIVELHAPQTSGPAPSRAPSPVITPPSPWPCGSNSMRPQPVRSSNSAGQRIIVAAAPRLARRPSVACMESARSRTPRG